MNFYCTETEISLTYGKDMTFLNVGIHPSSTKPETELRDVWAWNVFDCSDDLVDDFLLRHLRTPRTEILRENELHCGS
jgi:hypothetical protein